MLVFPYVYDNSSAPSNNKGVGKWLNDDKNIEIFNDYRDYDVDTGVGGNYSNSPYSHIEGYGNKDTSGTQNHIEGYQNTIERGSRCHAEGMGNTITNSQASHITGSGNSILNGTLNFVGGNSNVINASSYNVVFGERNTVQQGSNYSLVLGYDNISKGSTSYNIINGSNNSIAGSYNTIVSGTNNNIVGSRSIVLGGWNNAYGFSDGIVGGQNNTLGSENGARNFNYNVVFGERHTILTGLTRSIIGGYNIVIPYIQDSLVIGQEMKTPENGGRVEYSIVGGYNQTIGGSFVQSLLIGSQMSTGNIYRSIISGSSNNITTSDESIIGGLYQNISNTIGSLIISNSTTQSSGQISFSIISGGSHNLSGVSQSLIVGGDITANTSGAEISQSLLAGHDHTITKRLSSGLVIGANHTLDNYVNYSIISGDGNAFEINTIDNSYISGSNNAATGKWVINTVIINGTSQTLEENTNETIETIAFKNNIINGTNNSFNLDVTDSIISGSGITAIGKLDSMIVSGDGITFENTYDSYYSLVTGRTHDIDRVQGSIIGGLSNGDSTQKLDAVWSLIVGQNNSMYLADSSGIFGTYQSGRISSGVMVGDHFDADLVRKFNPRLTLGHWLYKELYMIDEYGSTYGQGYNTPQTGYAEWYTWIDTGDSTREGKFVTFVNDTDHSDKIALVGAPTVENPDYVLGVVVTHPAIIGNSSVFNHRNKYQTDAFGTPIKTNGQLTYLEGYVEGSAYDLDSDNSSLALIAIHGKVVVVDDGTCVAGQYCKPYTGGDPADTTLYGIGTASINPTDYRVIKRIDETHIEIVLK